MGGLGPAATIDFFAKVLAATPAVEDQDHLHLIIDNNPSVPNRHAAINGTGPDAAPVLVQMAQRLEHAGSDILVLVCNTAHAFKDQIERSVGIPFINMIDEAVLAVRRNHGDACKIGIMAAEGCLETGLYQQALLQHHLQPVVWDWDDLSRFMQVVYRIKAGQRSDSLKQDLVTLTQSLAQQGAEVIIAACTEIPLQLTANDIDLPLVICTDVLVDRTIAYATGELQLPDRTNK